MRRIALQRTVIAVTVLSRDGYAPASIEQVAHDITTGDFLGSWEVSAVDAIASPADVRAACIAVGNDGTYFDEEGFDVALSDTEVAALLTALRHCQERSDDYGDVIDSLCENINTGSRVVLEREDIAMCIDGLSALRNLLDSQQGRNISLAGYPQLDGLAASDVELACADLLSTLHEALDCGFNLGIVDGGNCAITNPPL